ncbi:MAG: Rv1733c family protein [Streptosporangiaceae bacterium]
MRSRVNRRLGENLARLARWLGFDRNPLRRGTDRVEGALRLVMIIVVVAVVPATAVAAGQWTYHYVVHQAQAQQAVDHQVTAVLLRDAPATGVPDPYTSVQTAWVPARWQPPGQPPRTGEVLAVAGARKGSTVRTWIDKSGAVTDPPLNHRVVRGDVLMAVMATLLLSGVLLLGAAGLARRMLDRRRLRAWEAEWRTSGPLWSGHRS